jgi:hypothetical protein
VGQISVGDLGQFYTVLYNACVKALTAGHDHLTLDTLRAAWQDIKRAKVVNFLDQIQALKGG